jgi:hypothetical protein
MTRWITAAALLCGSLVLAGDARACDKAAEGLAAFEDGSRLYADRKFAEAASRFEDAYGLACRVSALYNAGRAWQQAGYSARAADAYARALAVGLPEAHAAAAKSHVEALSREVGSLEVRGPSGATVSVAHAAGRPLPARVYLAPGQHLVTATFADGKTASRTETVAAGQSIAIDVTLPATVADPVPGPVLTPGPEPADHTPYFVAGGVSLGLAAGAGVAAIVLGVNGLATRDEFVEGGATSQTLHDEASTLRTATNVCWGVAGALAVTGVVLIVVPFATAEAEPAAVSFSVSPRGAALSGAF